MKAVPVVCAAGARLNLRRAGSATASPGLLSYPAVYRPLQSWRWRRGSPAAPPRGCSAGCNPSGPERAGDHAVSPLAPPPAAPASASLPST